MRRSTVSALVGIARGRSRRAAASPPTAALIRPWAAVRLRAPGVGAHQLGQALGEGVLGAGRVAAVEAAHVEAEVDPAAEGGQIGRTPPVAAVHGPAGWRARSRGSIRPGRRPAAGGRDPVRQRRLHRAERRASGLGAQAGDGAAPRLYDRPRQGAARGLRRRPLRAPHRRPSPVCTPAAVTWRRPTDRVGLGAGPPGPGPVRPGRPGDAAAQLGMRKVRRAGLQGIVGSVVQRQEGAPPEGSHTRVVLGAEHGGARRLRAHGGICREGPACADSGRCRAGVVAPGQGPYALSTSLGCATGRLRRRGAAVQDPPRCAFLQARRSSAPPHRGTEH